MIILHGATAQFGLPEASPYVTKTEIQLRMAGLPYEKRRAMPDTSPKGQLPWIDDEGDKVADSTFIRAHLEEKYGIDFDEGLSPVERAQAWAIERMLENQLCWTIIYFRWMKEENFAKGPGTWFAAVPGLGAQIQEKVRANMISVGVARHSEAEIVGLGDQSLKALSLLLGDKPYLFGARPCGVDATATAVLAAAMTPYFDTPIRKRALGYPNLVAYVERLMSQFYPEFDWTPEAVQREAA